MLTHHTSKETLMEQTPQVKLYHLFGVPVFTFTLEGGLYKHEKDFLLGLERRKNQYNVYTRSTYVLNEPPMARVKRFLDDCTTQSFRLYAEPPPETEIYITQSWVNFTSPGQYHHSHTHKNSYLSGTLYLQTIPDDNVVIESPIHALNRMYVEPQSWNYWNSEEWEVPVQDNTVLIFPSYLRHHVKTNGSNDLRISLAFNSFLKGKMGLSDTLTELVI